MWKRNRNGATVCAPHPYFDSGTRTRASRPWSAASDSIHGKKKCQTRVTHLQNSAARALTFEQACETSPIPGRARHFRLFRPGQAQECPFGGQRRTRLNSACPKGLFAFFLNRGERLRSLNLLPPSASTGPPSTPAPQTSDVPSLWQLPVPGSDSLQTHPSGARSPARPSSAP